MAEMGSQFVCLAHFSALQAKLHSQSMPKARQRGPEARQCTVPHVRSHRLEQLLVAQRMNSSI